MSHEIETIAYAHKTGSNQDSYQTPWHGLGVPVSNDLTPAQMLDKAGLNWNVVRAPCYADVDGEKIYTGKDVLYRDSDKRILTHTSEDWHEVQNSVFADFFTEFVLEGKMEMNTMGSLRQGNMVWGLAKIKDSFDAVKNDTVDSYLLFSNPHEYGRCIDIRFTAIRVVCNNTLTLALEKRGDLAVRLNHRTKFDAELVKKALNLSKGKMSSYKEMAQYMSKKKFTVEALAQYYKEVFPTLSKNDPTKSSRPAQIAQECLDTQPGAKYAKGSWWQAYNSATFTIDHLMGRSPDTRLQSAWYGVNRQRKLVALNKAIEYCDA